MDTYSVVPSLVQHFQKEMKGLHEPDPDGIVQLALKIKYNPKKMKKLATNQRVVKDIMHMHKAVVIDI